MSRSRFQSSRPSSPYGNDGNVYTTATETSFPADNIIHSTPQQHHTHTDDAHAFPQDYDQQLDTCDQNTQGSADMSIEIGRGTKRSTQQQHDDDLSSNAILSFGVDNSHYDIPDTPPSRPRNTQRKSDGTLRKEASIRRATVSVRANDAVRRMITGERRAVSESQARSGADAEAAQETATATVIGSRFAQQVSSSYKIPTRFNATAGLGSNHSTPRRQAAGNATVQSTTGTANQSFMLPDVPNITELISGARLDGTPLVNQTTSTRSRFVSASYRGVSHTQTHFPVTVVGLPEDEKAIFASLHMLRDRVNQLEQEKSEAQKHLEEYEHEVIELRSQLRVMTGRADSGLGSDEDTGDTKLSRAQKSKLEAKAKTAEERLERSERKASVSNITVTRITKERDVLLSQLATSYVNNESREKANEALQEAVSYLRNENEGLRAQLQRFEEQNALLRARLTSADTSESKGKEPIKRRSASTDRNGRENDIADGIQIDESVRSSKQRKRRAGANDHENQEDYMRETILRDLASRTKQEVQNQREAALASTATQGDHRTPNTRRRSRSQRRLSDREPDEVSGAPLRRQVSVPVELEQTKSLFAEQDATQRSTRSMKLTEQFEQDVTILSDLDPLDIARLRRKLEEEMMVNHGAGQDTRTYSATEFTARSMTRHPLSRRPSLKDTTARTDRLDLGDDSIEDIMKATTKSVRVQSPHTSDEISHIEDHSLEVGQMSSLSNISRRRRRTASTDGMTSAFIIPDLELNTTHSLPANLGRQFVQHKANQCTVCEHEETQVEIPMPVPVSEREELADVTNATIRPSQSPSMALAKVIKNLEDEIKHLKLKRDVKNRIYDQHDPALARRKRVAVKAAIDSLTAEIERKSDQVYALYDVLEGQKDTASNTAGRNLAESTEEEVEETLQSIGIDPAELSGRIGRKAPVGLGELDDLSDNSELPFEGFSEVDSEAGGARGIRV